MQNSATSATANSATASTSLFLADKLKLKIYDKHCKRGTAR